MKWISHWPKTLVTMEIILGFAALNLACWMETQI
jgi:hypothetical protein